MNSWLMGFTPTLLALSSVAIVRGGATCRTYWLAWCGLAATLVGDYFLAIKGAPLHTVEFLYGVAGFSVAQGCWIAFLRCHASCSPRVAFGLLFSIGILFAARVIPALQSVRVLCALGGYALLSITSVSFACGTHRLSDAWRYGLCTLFLSDALILFGQVLRVPYASRLVGTTYLLSLLLIAIAIMRCDRCPRPLRRLHQLKYSPYAIFIGGGIAFALFLIAMIFYPGTFYNPCMRMLSVLGRTRLNGIDYPACHYLFTIGLSISALAAARFFPALACFVKGDQHKAWLLWGGAINAAGLLAIAFVPENINGYCHNLGCFAAVGGGALVLFQLTSGRSNPRVSKVVRWSWLAWCLLLVTVFELFLLCHRFKLLPFAPYVPTCQKLLILTFAAWLSYYAVTLFSLTRKRSCRAAARSGILPP